jgi:hypothetical protein
LIEIKQYKTINGCLAAFFRCKVKDLDKQHGVWDYKDSQGVYHSTTNKKKIKELRKGDYWGWAEGKTKVHFWVGKKVSVNDMINLFSHELGHCMRPFHRCLKEEQKAAKYADVATTAYELAMRIENGEKGEWMVKMYGDFGEGE